MIDLLNVLPSESRGKENNTSSPVRES